MCLPQLHNAPERVFRASPRVCGEAWCTPSECCLMNLAEFRHVPAPGRPVGLEGSSERSGH